LLCAPTASPDSTPAPPHTLSLHDALPILHGHIEFDHANLEDFVLLRSDGLPTYHLSVVVDDVEMAITHVVRGDDHISNTPRTTRSEEHTSELQSLAYLVCRLLLEKKKHNQ